MAIDPQAGRGAQLPRTQPASTGETVAHLLSHPQPVERVLPLAIATARALEQLHSLGRFHGALHPGVVVLAERSDAVALAPAAVRPRTALAYMAPEEPESTANAPGPRSDLYSLGAILYELLAGAPVFDATDALEWTHSHLARRPVDLRERRGDVPAVLAAIVMRLLAKTPRERYGSARGLRVDLERCWASWQRRAEIDPFPIDAGERLALPGRLHGRDRELDVLRAALARVSGAGGRELVAVGGVAGIGKSALVQAIAPFADAQGAVLAAGKMEQADRQIPYAGFVAALASGIDQLIAGLDAAALAEVRGRVQSAVAPNGQLLVDFAPAIERLLGPQPAPPQLPVSDELRVFSLVMLRFLTALAARVPLVLFIDDLQWADAPTIELLSQALADESVTRLLVVVAYRDGDSGNGQLARLQEHAAGRSETIALGPLTAEAITELLAEALARDPVEVAALASQLRRRTGGNPYHLSRVLASLATDDLLHLDGATASWEWDAERLEGDRDARDVIDLTEGRVRRLSERARELLATVACVGRPARVELLAAVSGLTEGDIEAELQAPARDQLVSLNGGVVAFAHDNVRAAAERLTDETSRPGMHLAIARALLALTPAEQLAEHVYAILDQFERGGAPATEGPERHERAALYLLAGRRAKLSNAYSAAADYLDRGLGLGDDALRLPLGIERAEVAVARRETELATEMLERLAPAEPLDIARVGALAIEFHQTAGALDRALAAGVSAARALGLELQVAPGHDRALAAVEQLDAALGGRAVGELIDLPPLRDEVVQAQLVVLSALWIPAYFADPELFLMLSALNPRLSIEHGNGPASAPGYLGWGVQLTHRLDRPLEGYEWGRFALELAERGGDPVIRVQSRLMFLSMLVHPVRPLPEAAELVESTLREALQVGALSTVGHLSTRPAMHSLATGVPLLEVRRDIERSLALLRPIGYQAMTDRLLSGERLIASLRGETAGLGRLDGPGFDLAALERRMRDEHPPPVRLGYELTCTRAALFANDVERALRAARATDALLWSTQGIIDEGEAVFACALAYARADGHVEPGADGEPGEALSEKLAWLRRLARHGPSYRHRVHLVEAEIARRAGDALTALERYDAAIEGAAEAGFTCDEALAAELAARHHRDAGRTMLAQACARRARDAYVRWQATGKVAALEEEFGLLAAADGARTGGDEHGVDGLAIVKTSQAISASVVLSDLLDTLLRVALQHAGADGGALLLLEEDGLHLRAEAHVHAGDTHVQLHERHEEPPLHGLPAVIERARHERRAIVVQDARSEAPYASDPDVLGRGVCSMLCLPLLRQGALGGLLYLENRLTAGAFTAARVQTLELLGSQAAISLENARLYSEREYLADHDPLTHLHNRRSLDRELAALVRRGDGASPATLLVLDLDNLKDINDSLGHDAGDQLIVSVARVLSQSARDTDVLARIGGDEFAILLHDTDAHAAVRLAARLREAIGTSAVIARGHRVQTTASIGIAPAHPGGASAAEILAAADIAMYEAKEGGRDRVAVYTSQSSEEVHTRLSTVQRLRAALEHDGLVVERQPIRDLQSGQIRSYELLVRLVGEEGELVQPAGFLPVAERNGLITHIDRWVTAHAIGLLADGSHDGLSLAVNLSARSLADGELPDWVAARLASSGIDPSRLVFEITETAAIANMQLAAGLASQLRALGCRFALDDFGAGFGSFYYLKHLPLDVVKLDGDFIVNLPDDPVNQLVVRAMVDIARGMGLRTVAEYVQDAQTERLLQGFGVSAVQGFHIGRPEPVPAAGG